MKPLLFLARALISILPCAAALAADNPDFPKVYNSREETPLFKPEEAVKHIQLPPGFHATLFASEPDVQQPIAMTTDARGRLWVAENYTYSERQLNFDLKLHDRILIFSDTNHDGHFDKRTVFYDRAQKLTSLAVGFGGVYALCPPKLLFIPDRNGDDVPDGEPQVLLDGFDAESIRHNIANGLKWGPDGWLYGRHGIQATSQVGPPGATPEQRTRVNAGIWRFHPVTHKFEMVAEGTTNPWGSDWDENGQLFFINTVIGHLWHVIPGAFYRRMYGEHPNPHLYELLEQTADHFHWDTHETWDQIRKLGVTPTTSEAGGGHAHSGLMMYLGDNWPEQYRNQLFTLNFHGRRINHDIVERQGADYTAHHAPDFMTVDDPWFRGLDLLYGPDGTVMVSDWSDIGECHNQEAIHRTSGRIYSIAYGEPTNHWSGDLTKSDNAELVRLQLQHNDWFVRQARLVLQERAARGEDMTQVRSDLRRMLQERTDPTRQLRALWALYVTGGVDEGLLRKLLGNENEQLRVWAIQLAVDQGAPSDVMLAEFARMAKTDKSGLVLSFLASAMRRAPLESRWAIAAGLAEHAEFAADRVLPLMLWYGLEPAVPAFPARAVALARDTKIPKLRRFLARRIFDDLTKNPAAADQVVALLKNSSDAGFQFDILSGISEALQGVQKALVPASWAAVGPGFKESPDKRIRDLGRELNALFGDGRAIDDLKLVVADQKADLTTRRHALQTLLQGKSDGLTPLLVTLLDERDIAPDAIRGLAAVGESATPTILLQRYGALKSDAAKAEAVNTLLSRKAFARLALEAIQRGGLARQTVGASQIRQLLSFNDPEIKRQVTSIWPQMDDSPGGKQLLFARYKGLLTPGRLQAASPPEGRKLFQQTCAVCHTLFGEGAKIGPDLTGSDRRNLDYLLDNILDPSGVVPETYRASQINLKDGRVVNGIVLSKTDQTVTVQTISEKMSLPRPEIESLTESKLSLMPDGLFESLRDQQTLDLIAYLMSPSQVPLPASKESK